MPSNAIECSQMSSNALKNNQHQEKQKSSPLGLKQQKALYKREIALALKL